MNEPDRRDERTRPIARGPRAPCLRGVLAHRLGDLDPWPAAAGRRPLFCDLTLGAWSTDQAAAELLAQLGRGLPAAATRRPPGAARAELPSYADTVAAGIDAESRGRQRIARSYRLAARVIAALPAAEPVSIVVLAPQAPAAWDGETVAFLRFLSHALEDGPHEMTLVARAGVTPPELPAQPVDWQEIEGRRGVTPEVGLTGLVPGLVPAPLAERLAELEGRASPLVELANGLLLVPFEARSDPRHHESREYDRLAVAAAGFPRIAAYAQLHGSNIHVDPWRLAEQAWDSFSQGGQQVALALISRALECAPGRGDREVFEVQLQGMRIAALRFDELADSRDPAPSQHPELEGFLLLAKGWGLVLAGRAEEAGTYLERARTLDDPARSPRESLYLENIYALFLLRTGDPEGALACERRIEAALAELDPRDQQLTYINSINTARLLLKAGDAAGARRYYRAAFSTCQGVSSESDGIHRNVCMARTHDLAGPSPHGFEAWLWTALRWLAAEVPEALAPRVGRVIAGAAGVGGFESVEQVSAALEERLRHAANGGPIRVEPPAAALDAPLFAGSWLRRPGAGRPDALWVAGGAAGPLAAAKTGAPVWDGPAHRRLRATVVAVLEQLMAAAPWREAGTILVPDHQDGEPGAGPSEAVELALAVGAPRVFLGERELGLTPDLRTRLTGALGCRLAPAVAGVESRSGFTRISFKRYLPPRILGPAVAAVLAAALDGTPVAELALDLDLPQDRTVRILRALESARIVTLSLARKECDELEGLVSGRV